MLIITFTPSAYADYLGWLNSDKKTFLIISELVRETARNPVNGIGKPEALKHDLKGIGQGESVKNIA